MVRAARARVDEVLPDAAKHLLDQHDCDDGTDGRHPPGGVGGKVEGQQEARNNGAQIVDGRLLVSDFFIHQFGKNCKDDRYKHQCQRGRAKEPDGRQRGRNQGDHNISHQPARGYGGVAQERR